MFCAGLLCSCAWAQSEDNPVSLGDLARSMRNKNKKDQPTPAKPVIDNDNFSQVMDEVEARHLPGTSMVYSFDGAAKTFQVSTPDVTCSLSFNGKTSSLLARPHVAVDLPEEELHKLEGPARISDDGLEISVFNGTDWKVEELTIGLTIVQRSNETAHRYGIGKLVPVASETTLLAEKHPDVTTLHRLKGNAPPAATSIFKTALNAKLGPDQEWHWAIIQARGEPPENSPDPAPLPSDTHK
jgi:hypothetical protein